MTQDPCDPESAIIVVMICKGCNGKGKFDATSFEFSFASNTPAMRDPRCSILIDVAEAFDETRTRCKIGGDKTHGQGKLRPMAHKTRIFDELSDQMSSLTIGSISLTDVREMLDSKTNFECLLSWPPTWCGACDKAKKTWPCFVLTFSPQDLEDLNLLLETDIHALPLSIKFDGIRIALR